MAEKRGAGAAIAKDMFKEVLMRRNWGWVGARKDEEYKLGCA